MYAKAGQTMRFVAGFTTSGTAATGLTVTCKVWELRTDGSKYPNDTTGTTATVTEIGGGGYYASHTVGADCVPIAVFSTSGTADVKAILTGAFSLAYLDAAVSSRSTLDAAGVRGAVGLASANLDTQLGTIDDLVDDLEGRLTATRAGYLDNLDATVSSRASQASVDAISASIGPGSDSVTLHLGSIGAGAEVWISTDAAGASVVAGTLVADDSGDVTFMLDAGDTYYRWVKKPGTNWTNPQRFVAVAD